jgi:hypothetical protein
VSIAVKIFIVKISLKTMFLRKAFMERSGVRERFFHGLTVVTNVEKVRLQEMKL